MFPVSGPPKGRFATLLALLTVMTMIASMAPTVAGADEPGAESVQEDTAPALEETGPAPEDSSSEPETNEPPGQAGERSSEPLPDPAGEDEPPASNDEEGTTTDQPEAELPPETTGPDTPPADDIQVGEDLPADSPETSAESPDETSTGDDPQPGDPGDPESKSGAAPADTNEDTATDTAHVSTDKTTDTQGDEDAGSATDLGDGATETTEESLDDATQDAPEDIPEPGTTSLQKSSSDSGWNPWDDIFAGTITVTLTDEVGTPLAGHEFELHEPGPRPSSIGLTDASGQVDVTIPEVVISQTFLLRQLTAPTGCTIAPDQTVELNLDMQHAYLHFISVCEEDPLPLGGSLTVTLTDQHGTPLAGASFELTSVFSGPGSGITDTTDSAGQLTFHSLPLEYPYLMRQVTAPAGCTLAADQIAPLTSAKPHGYLRFINTCGDIPGADFGTVIIVATDQMGNPLPHVEFGVVGLPAGPEGNVSTDEHGELVITPVLFSSLEFEQRSVPEGCVAPENQTAHFTTSAPLVHLHFTSFCGDIPPAVGPVLTATVTDQAGNIQPGIDVHVKLQVFTSLETIATGTTDDNGIVVFNLPYGTPSDVPLIVRQMTSFDGCIPAPDQNVVFAGTQTRAYAHLVSVCEAIPTSGSISLIKVDQFGAQRPGATFELSAPGMPPRTGTTDAAGELVFDGLPTGGTQYTIQETAAPEGCTAGTDRTITLLTWTPDRRMYVANECVDTRARTSLTILKMDELGAALELVEFEVYDGDTMLASGSTDLSGEVTFTNLPVDSNLRLHEVTAPEGCGLGPDRTVRLSEGVPGYVEVINECAGPAGTITVSMIDHDGAPLADVTFEVHLWNGTTFLDTPYRGTTDSTGKAIIGPVVLYGDYQVSEFSAPEGCTGAEPQRAQPTEASPNVSLTFVNDCRPDPDTEPGPDADSDPDSDPGPDSNPGPDIDPETPTPTPTAPAPTPTDDPGGDPEPAPGDPRPSPDTTTPETPSDVTPDESASDRVTTAEATSTEPTTRKPTPVPAAAITMATDGPVALSESDVSRPEVRALPNTGSGSVEGGYRVAGGVLALTLALVAIGSGLRLRRP